MYGGAGDEREVSLSSGACVAEALCLAGHTVLGVDWNGKVEHIPFGALAASDAVFLALHGGSGENGELQSALEEQGIFHYTGSSPYASSLAMNKGRAKAAVAPLGVPVAAGFLLSEGKTLTPASLPLVVKPLCGGSSVGLLIIKSEKDLENPLPRGVLLCEEYLPGREYSVGILEGVPLPPVEIIPHNGVYDYKNKYTVGATREECPARVDKGKLATLKREASAAFFALGLRDYARIDFKEDAAGVPRFLEANTLPGMTKTSLLPLAASVAGFDMSALCQRMVIPAARRKRTGA